LIPVALRPNFDQIGEIYPEKTGGVEVHKEKNYPLIMKESTKIAIQGVLILSVIGWVIWTVLGLILFNWPVWMGWAE
jgi:hypothetical protein